MSAPRKGRARGVGLVVRVTDHLHIGPYRVLRPLGRAGHVFRVAATDTRANVDRALYVLNGPEPARREAVRAWAAAVSRVAHPNLAEVVEVVETDTHLAVVEALIEGPSVAAAIADAPFTVDQADDLGDGILEGLRALHAEGIVHGAPTPSAVILEVGSTGPTPRLVAPGLAAALGGLPPAPYCPPEVRDEGAAWGQTADLYAVGGLLYALLAGADPPVDDGSALGERLDAVEVRQAAAVARALRADRDQRAQTVGELLAVWSGVNDHVTGRIAPRRAWDGNTVSRLRELRGEDSTTLSDLHLRPPAPTRPSALAIARVDTAASQGIVAAIVVWIALIIAIALGRVPADPGAWLAFMAEDPFPALLTAAGTLGGLGLAAWRIRRVQRLLADGAPVHARVASADFFRGRGRIRLTYRYGGVPVATWVAVRDVPAARALRAGAEVAVRVDPEAPEHATLPALFDR